MYRFWRLFVFVKVTKFRYSSGYSDCVQNVLAKSYLPCQCYTVYKPKKYCSARKGLGTSLALGVTQDFLAAVSSWRWQQETEVNYRETVIILFFPLFTLSPLSKIACSSPDASRKYKIPYISESNDLPKPVVTGNGLLMVTNIIFSRRVLKEKHWDIVTTDQHSIQFNLFPGEYLWYRGIECRGIFSLKLNLLPQLQTTHLTHLLIFVPISLKIKKKIVVPGKTSSANMEKANFTNFKVS